MSQLVYCTNCKIFYKEFITYKIGVIHISISIYIVIITRKTCSLPATVYIIPKFSTKLTKQTKRLFYFFFYQSLLSHEYSQNSRGREGAIFYSTVPLPPAHEQSGIYYNFAYEMTIK